MDNQYQPNMPNTPARARAARDVDALVQRGGLFVEAVQRTRMPMMVADATLPGNPITFANPAFVALSGYSSEELLGQEPHFMNGAGTDLDTVERLASAMREGQNASWEIVQYRKDGSAFRALLFASPVEDTQGTVTSHFLSYLDVTRRWEAEESLRVLTADLETRIAERTAQLQRVSETDPLTGALNRRGYNRLAEEEFVRARRAGEKLTVVMMDIDHFKHVNDRYGHATGDQVLVKVADVCAKGIRAGDLVGRTGGEEFALVLAGGAIGAARHIVDWLRAQIAACIVPTPQGDLSVTASFGVVHGDPATMDLTGALSCADAALYEAKNSGRDCVIVSA
jgi:diguanylate cyclase (GGDEF)-like protein/PAS domain S-box-containing protein